MLPTFSPTIGAQNCEMMSLPGMLTTIKSNIISLLLNAFVEGLIMVLNTETMRKTTSMLRGGFVVMLEYSTCKQAEPTRRHTRTHIQIAFSCAVACICLQFFGYQ